MQIPSALARRLARQKREIQKRLEKESDFFSDKTYCLHDKEKSLISLEADLKAAKKVKNSKEAYNEYLQSLKEAPTNIRISLLGTPENGVFNKNLLGKLIGKTQQAPASCYWSIRGIASQILKGGKRVSDARILRERTQLEERGKLVKPKVLPENFDTLIKKLKKGKIIEARFNRTFTFPYIRFLRLKKEYAKDLNGKYLITVSIPTYSGGFKNYFLMDNKNEILKLARKIENVGKTRMIFDDSSKLYEGQYFGEEIDKFIADKKGHIFSSLPANTNVLPYQISHYAFIIGARQDKNGKRYVTIYDQNYKRAKVPAVYEIPFGICSEIREYQ